MKRVAVSGARGLVGNALLPRLRDGGWDVVELARRPQPGGVVWNPSGDWDSSPLEGIDAVIHLAGASVGERWTAEHKAEIRDSRTRGTESLCRGLLALKRRPAVLVSASAVGLYGNRGDAVLDEDSGTGDGFLAEVVEGWEAACASAREAGIRVVNLRLGVVLAEEGGALAKMLPPFKMGAGGPIGDGRQYLSWVALSDAARAFEFALDHLKPGQYNLVAPEPVQQREFARTLGHVLHRPAVVPLPAMAVKLMFGQMGEEVLLYSQRVSSKRLRDAGFAFEWTTLDRALRHIFA